MEAARRRPVLAAIGTRVKPERNQDDPKGQKEQRAHRPNESHLPNPFCKAGTGNKQPCWDGQGEGDALEIKVTKRNKKKGVYASARTFGAVPWGGEGLFNGPQVRWVAAGRGTGAEEERPAGKLRLDLIRPLVRPLPNSRVVGGSIMDIIIIQTNNNSVTEKKKCMTAHQNQPVAKARQGGKAYPLHGGSAAVDGSNLCRNLRIEVSSGKGIQIERVVQDHPRSTPANVVDGARAAQRR